MNTTSKFELYLPGFANRANHEQPLICADIHEEETVMAYFEVQDEKLVSKFSQEYPTKQYECFCDIVNEFKTEHNLSVQKLAVAVPGPVINRQATSARLSWVLAADDISTKTDIPNVYLINDLEATAYGLSDLPEDLLIPFRKSDVPVKGNVAILSPGEGLGEAGLFYDGEFLRPFATEGGHSEFSPRTNVEVEFYQFLNKIYGIVSWENVLSNNGLFNIFRFLRDEKRHPISEKLAQRLRSGDKFPEVLYAAAVEDNEMIATITINTFLEFLAREANSLVLKLKATGGLILSGELAILFEQYIDKARFYQKFLISDKMEKLLNNTPIYMLCCRDAVMQGAAVYAAFSK